MKLKLDKKKCSGCKKTKLLMAFHKNKRTRTGRAYYCIPCTAESNKKSYQTNKKKAKKLVGKVIKKVKKLKKAA